MQKIRVTSLALFLVAIFTMSGFAEEFGVTTNRIHLENADADYTPGAFHNYSHKAGNLPEEIYQYSVFVPQDYDPDKSYPLVFFLHGGKGRSHPDQGKRNMVAATLRDNVKSTDAGYSQNDPDYIGYILVSPVKPVLRWNAQKFKQLLDHVKSKVSIDENRVCVTGFSMGGQGTWRVGCGTDGSYNLAAMMPMGAWGCDEVKRGGTRESCKTIGTAVWVLHCPLDHVSKISEQIPLFQSHLDHGGYGRFTMIPGKGHISRPRNDREFFNLRMSWMLAQTYSTPFNYLVSVNDGTIEKVVNGKRPFTGHDSRYGFYEPGTVVNVTAAKSKNGKPFVKWASDNGSFSNASERSTSYTTSDGDVEISAVYDVSRKLTVMGGTANPAEPAPGDIVTITADANSDENKFMFWKTSSMAIDIAVPTKRSISFAMPSEDVTLTAQLVPAEQMEKDRRAREDSDGRYALINRLREKVEKGELTQEEAIKKYRAVFPKSRGDGGR